MGAATALFAATIALVQTDIKRVLAYSTVSQLGYMFLACGVGAFGAGIFHVFTHAFFKALLFLGAGSVIHALAGEQDMRKMGGLRARAALDARSRCSVACLAIAGIPFFAGFFSKDEILWSAYRVGGYGRAVWAVGIVTAALTAFYMFRLYAMTFAGQLPRPGRAAHHLHEAPASDAPAARRRWPRARSSPASWACPRCSAARIASRPSWSRCWSRPARRSARCSRRAAPGHGVELALMALSVLVAPRRASCSRGASTPAPRRCRAGWPRRSRWRTARSSTSTGWTRSYAAVFVRGLALGGGGALYANDRFVIDGGDGELRAGLGVNGVGVGGARPVVARASNLWDRYVVDGAVRLTAFALDNLSYLLRALQNGLVQRYALSMLIGLFLLIAAGRFVLELY